MNQSTAHNKPTPTDVESLLRVVALATRQISDDATHSMKMHTEGLDTKMTQHFEQALNNPVQNLLEFGTRVNNDILKVLGDVVRLYLQAKSQFIDQAYVEQGHPLHFYIALNEESMENRSELNDFFDSYFMEDFSERFPILFTYSTRERLERATGLQRLRLDEQAS